MFTDEVLEAVGMASLWRKSRETHCKSKSSQTEDLVSTEAAVQALYTTETGTQTRPSKLLTQDLDQVPHADYPGLVKFLQTVEDNVIRELKKNVRSHAFDGFEVNWVDQNQTVSCLHTLQYPEAQSQHLHVTNVSWNATGSVIACAYGRLDDGDWSTENSFVCTWNLDRRGLNPKRPDMVLDAPSAVMCLAFHPTQPCLIAGGLYNGEVLLWDTSRTDDPLTHRTGLSEDTPTEPVYQICWIQDPSRYQILSASTDGKVLIWQTKEESRLALQGGYALVAQQMPHNIKLRKGRGDTPIGVTALSFSRFDPDLFITGVEGGYLLKCSAGTGMLAMTNAAASSVPLKAPAQFTFSPHCGPVYAVDCSPFHRHLFVSAGTDGHVRLYSMLQAHPLLSVQLSKTYLFSICWSPRRPLVFAVATGEGKVLICDLGQGSVRPAATMEQSADQSPVYCLEFNQQQAHLLAAGNADGTVKIWQLNTELTEQGPREIGQLEQLANMVTD
ncbi:WD repeat-containing protein 34 [Latimeria chalumnae]|uniref:Dynein 2 intermediate chain 2 n=1 Tax=Latimeria chalumnae TaxID=7897 RepID=H3B3P3_LATCH|nr:PREDICTED: WD repeat-containing protein 34 [Latimeria chalumnae]|eukprot:XP_005992148.1 PREDICTED: WD repeat-containing protein 34 [Latimeria chalumnae]